MNLDVLAHGEPCTLCNQAVRSVRFWGLFLSQAATRPSSVVPARARAGQFRAFADSLTFLMDPTFVLHLQSVSPFTSGRFRRRSYSGSAAIPKEEATKAAFSSPPRCQHRFVGDLSMRLTDRRAAWDFTGHGLGPFSPGGRRQHPRGPWPITARPATRGPTGRSPTLPTKGGAWRSTPAETAVSRSLPAWPLRDGAFSGTPGGTALAAYPREVARCEQGVLYGCGPAQVGFGATCSPPFFTSPFVLLINLVRATTAHAPFQG